MAKMAEAVLVNITLSLRQDGAVVVDCDSIDPAELVAILDGGREVYENAHTLASVVRIGREAYDKLNDDVRNFIT